MNTKSVVPLLLGAITLAYSGCGRGKGGEQSAERESSSSKTHFLTLRAEAAREIGLTLSVVKMDTLKGAMNIPAKLIPNQDLEALVGSLVQGRVRKVFVKVGDYVQEGQELMHIEGLEVGEIKSNFIKAKAELKYAEANYQRQKTLLDQNVGSQKVFLEAQSAYDKALAGFNAEDKRIHSIGLSDDDLLKFVEHSSTEANNHSGGVLPIKAPLTGIIVERNVVNGQLVDASSTAFRIVNTSTLWADGQVYEKDLPKLSGKPGVSLTVTAYPREEFQGKVIYVSPVVDERTRTISLRASIPNGSGRLKPQMFGELHVPVSSGTLGLLVPGEAVLNDNSVSYVFVAVTDTTFEKREISTGASFDSLVEVKSGLRTGDRVVTRGSFQLKSELMKEVLEGGD